VGIDGVRQLDGAGREVSSAGEAGIPLSSLLRAGPLALDELLRIACELAETIVRVHGRGIVHQRIHPEHVLLCGEGRSVLLDGREGAMTPHGQSAASLSYQAPEQTGRTARPVDHRADLYGLGATLYAAACGVPPFSSENPLELIRQQLATDARPAAELRPELPEALSSLIARLLDKEPDARYQSASGVLADLRKVQKSLGSVDTHPIVLGEYDFPHRIAAPAAPVGRAREIALMRSALESAVQDQGGVLLVSGEAGVGKTSVAHEMLPMCVAAGGWVALGKFDQYRNEASRGFVQALRMLGRQLLALPEEELAHEKATIRSVVGANLAALCAMPEFTVLFGTVEAAEEFDRAQAELRLVLAASDLLRAMASRTRPLVLILEDMQWADATSLRIIDSVLGQQIGGLLLTVTFRTSEVASKHPLSHALLRWRAQARCTSLALGPLAQPQLGDMLAAMLRLNPRRALELAGAIGKHTGGNPFHTVELVNALRRAGILTIGESGWDWPLPAVEHYVGSATVESLLAARLEQLPAGTLELLRSIACLGGEDITLDLLATASGHAPPHIDQLLASALEDGVVLVTTGPDALLKLRHDRVQQAVYSGIASRDRQGLHLCIARNLRGQAAYRHISAQQFVAAGDRLPDTAGEQQEVSILLLEAASEAAQAGAHANAQALLACGLRVIAPIAATHPQLRRALLTARHQALFSLGRFAHADAVYRDIARSAPPASELAAAVCVQVESLAARGRTPEGLALGLATLRMLGIDVPEQFLPQHLESQLDALRTWLDRFDLPTQARRPEASDPRVLAAAELLRRLQMGTVVENPLACGWLVLTSQALLDAHGPCAALLASLGHAMLPAVWLRQDYAIGYRASRTAVELARRRGDAAGSLGARFWHAQTAAHWFEPLSNIVAEAKSLREAFSARGDLTSAAFTYRISAILMDTPATLEEAESQISEAVSFCRRIGNDLHVRMNQVNLQLVRALRGRTAEPLSLSESGFDEDAFARTLPEAVFVRANYRIAKALLSVIMGEMEQALGYLEEQVPGPVLDVVRMSYVAVWAQLGTAMGHAARLRREGVSADGLASLTRAIAWLERRAADAPGNFAAVRDLALAERAWALDDSAAAAALFAAALQSGEACGIWHRALIGERAGLFNLALGDAARGRELLRGSRAAYAHWGAEAKVRQLEQAHSFLAPGAGAVKARAQDPRGPPSLEPLDTVAILQASQALSTETSLAGLTARVEELLKSLAGAVQVQLAWWDDVAREWFTRAPGVDDRLTVDKAARQGRLCLPVFHYVRRTGETLLLPDAARDERFKQDAYLAGGGPCSMLAMPIRTKSTVRAILILENRLARGAFTLERLGTVRLIAGQLAVSLENAMLYDQLEARVQQQTLALREAQAQLLGAAHRSGMAQIATNVLHNVGNLLNSINVSASLLERQVNGLKLAQVGRVAQLFDGHEEDLADFLSRDDRGRKIPAYLHDLERALLADRDRLLDEVRNLARTVEQTMNVVSTQQTYAGAGGLREWSVVSGLVDDALRIVNGSTQWPGTIIVRDMPADFAAEIDKSRVLQILVNLVSNAKHAMQRAKVAHPQLAVSVQRDDAHLRITVADNGEGIAAENLTLIFSHGFTTKADGHGFGLHSCANAAGEMGGRITASSGGAGQGARFTLEIPL